MIENASLLLALGGFLTTFLLATVTYVLSRLVRRVDKLEKLLDRRYEVLNRSDHEIRSRMYALQVVVERKAEKRDLKKLERHK